jgi:hypothetical protein
MTQDNLTAKQLDYAVFLPAISGPLGLICIDIWETDFYNTQYPIEYYQWIDQLLIQLQQFKFDSIINAGYNTRLDYNDPSIYNTLIMYNWHKFDQEVMLELIKNCNNFVMSSTIQKKLFGSNSFALYSVNSFLKHVNNVVPHIKNWLVVGNTWQICTHCRDLGLINLSKIKDLNFYGADWGFIKLDNQHCTEDDFKQDRLNWKKIDEHFYKLIPQ